MYDCKSICEEYREKGVVCIRNFVDAGCIATIRQELARFIAEDLNSAPPKACTREADGVTVRNLWHLEEYSEYFRDLSLRPDIIDLVRELLNGEPVLIAVETFNKPARIGSGVPYHQDNAYFCLAPPDALTVWIAIDPVTAENGPVHYVESSHTLGMLPTKQSGVTGNSIGLATPPSVPKEMQLCATLAPGDASIHHCLTVHHSDPNKTENSRLGLLLVYRGAHTEKSDELLSNYTCAVQAASNSVK